MPYPLSDVTFKHTGRFVYFRVPHLACTYMPNTEGKICGFLVSSSTELGIEYYVTMLYSTA